MFPNSIGLFLSSWYSQPVLDFAYKTIDTPEFDRKLDRIIRFENALADEGYANRVDEGGPGEKATYDITEKGLEAAKAILDL